jgi:hypothetical protein
MTTDNDILAALRGQHAPDSAIAEAFGRTQPAKAAEAEPAPQKRGDAFEAVAIWAATEAAATSTRALSEAIMRADGAKGIYEAEAEAKAIASEAYEEAAKGSPYEVTRQEAVSRIVTKLAENFTRMANRTTKRPTPATTGRTRQEAATRRNVRITESASGRITVLPN